MSPSSSQPFVKSTFSPSSVCSQSPTPFLAFFFFLHNIVAIYLSPLLDHEFVGL